MGKILIKNGNVWDGDKFFPSDVLILSDKIAEIAENIDENKAEFIYDASGKIVSCGLVDAHMHIREISPDLGVQPEVACMPFGVTSVVDASATYGSRTILDNALIKGLVFAACRLENNRAYFENTEKILSEYGEYVSGVKLFFDTEGADVRDATALCDVISFAEKKNLRVMVHSSNSPIPIPELLSHLRPGDIFTHAYHGGPNNSSEDNFECIFDAKRRGVIIDAGLAGHIHTDFKIFRDAISKGAIPDIISTDLTIWSSYKRGGRYGMTMCMNIARSLGMSDEDIFRAVTSNPAKALSKADEWGYLKVGRSADVAVFEISDEGSDLVLDLTDKAGNRIFSDVGYRCVLTIADGEVVYRR